MTKVFVVHGWTYSLDKWTAVIDQLKQLSIELVMLKVPGLTAPSDKAWTIDDYVDWLDGELKGVEQPVVIGHSNGGRVAMIYAQRYPGRLGRLILIDSAGITHDERRLTAKLKMLRWLSKIGKLFSYIPPVRKLFYKVIGAQDYLNAPPNMRRTMRNMLAADRLVDLSKINLPVTIIWGSDDTITPLADGQKLQAGIAGSDLRVVNGARHSPFFTEPRQVAELIAAAAKNPPEGKP